MRGRNRESRPDHPGRAIRAAGLVYVANGAGFGVAAIVSLIHFARNGELPLTPFGFRALSGPFERLGRVPFLALGSVFVGLCALESLVGVWLWRGRRTGAVAGVATTPLALVLGLGFALPFYLASVPLRLGLLVVGLRTLR